MKQSGLIKKIVFVFTMCCAVALNSKGIVYAGNVGLIGIQATGHDHTSYFSSINNYLNLMGYPDSAIGEYTNITYNTTSSILDSDEIIVIRSHGYANLNSSGVYTETFMTLSNRSISNTDVAGWAANRLSNAKIIFYGGCLTAAGGISLGTERNLVVASSNKGATTVIGFMNEVNCLGVNELVRCFF